MVLSFCGGGMSAMGFTLVTFDKTPSEFPIVGRMEVKLVNM